MITDEQLYIKGGYAKHFECRTEFLFKNVLDVLDAPVREYAVNGLPAARVEDVITGKDEVLLILGRPNSALVIGSGKGEGYQKFSAFSLWRKPSQIEDVTRKSGSFVQSGIWIHLLNIPEATKIKLREGMEKYSNKKFPTCVKGNMHVLGYAGFTTAGESLSGISMPHTLMTRILRCGLMLNGKDVDFVVIRTTRLVIQDYWWSVFCAEGLTPYRHLVKNTPLRNLSVFKKTRSNLEYKAAVAPALPIFGVNYANDFTIKVSQPILFGRILRQVWGPHALFEACAGRISIDNYFTKALRPFPQKNPTLLTQIKKKILFSTFTIWCIRFLMGANRGVQIGIVNERNIYDRLRTHSPAQPNIYNMVVVRVPPKYGEHNPTTRIILARVTVRSRIVDWVLSKHVLMSGYLWAPLNDSQTPDLKKPFPVWAGEVWKDAEGVLNLCGNSGTYMPTGLQDQAALMFLQNLFANLRFKLKPRQ